MSPMAETAPGPAPTPPRRPTIAALPASPRAGAGPSGARRLVVRLLKRVLPLAAVLLLAAIALWPQWQGTDEARRFTFRRGATDLLNEPLRMRDAIFRGIDERGRPYTVTAQQAIQVGQGDDTIDLVQPKADITLEDGTWALVQSVHGTYRRIPQLLELDGGVILNHDAGYEVRTESATINLRDQTAQGDRPVAGQGPFGTIEGTGFQADDAAKVLVVTGPATLVLQGLEQ